MANKKSYFNSCKVLGASNWMLDAALLRSQPLRVSTSSINLIHWGCSAPLLKLLGVQCETRPGDSIPNMELSPTAVQLPKWGWVWLHETRCKLPVPCSTFLLWLEELLLELVLVLRSWHETEQLKFIVHNKYVHLIQKGSTEIMKTNE